MAAASGCSSSTVSRSRSVPFSRVDSSTCARSTRSYPEGVGEALP